MRGPAYKLTGDVRRVWRCSLCGRERKASGEVTTVLCGCQEGVMMKIVREKTNAPRPIQRPSDVERRPSDFGIEAAPPPPPKPVATIIKPAVSLEVEELLVVESQETPVPSSEESASSAVPSPEPVKPESEEEWGEGIL